MCTAPPPRPAPLSMRSRSHVHCPTPYPRPTERALWPLPDELAGLLPPGLQPRGVTVRESRVLTTVRGRVTSLPVSPEVKEQGPRTRAPRGEARRFAQGGGRLRDHVRQLGFARPASGPGGTRRAEGCRPSGP